MSEEQKDGGPAFATPINEYGPGQKGMSLRDYFSGEAMRALIEITDPLKEIGIKATAEKAYRIADAMLEEREK